MFQTFEVTSRPEQGPPRLAALRAALARAGMDACLVPHADAWQGEYLAPCDERLAWLTGFTGSAGFAAITATEAGVFIDGRYRLQVRAQVAPDFTPVHWPEVKLGDWLAARLAEGSKIAYDPWLHTIDEVETLDRRLAPGGITLVPAPDPIAPLWTDRPARPDAPLTARPRGF
ncbi:MAG: aminopeptidase P family N-terminal domain-containing protein, partial [Rubellimicrobium sp.]|nr:aminopeptidase P family N-terminal domain-containing protein [Rubellimicrobium sp.]